MVDKHNFCKARKEIIMLRQANEFKTFKLRARDGDIGNAKEFYFDDQYWTVRYLVAGIHAGISQPRLRD
jgi:hypothetical protein